MALTVNMEKSGNVSGVGMSKLRVVIDGTSREEIDSQAAKEMARKASVDAGFGGGGMCDNPIIGPVGEDGEMFEDADALNPNKKVAGFRAEYLFAQRI